MADSTENQHALVGEMIAYGRRLERVAVEVLAQMAFTDRAHAQVVLAGLPISGLLSRIRDVHAVWSDPGHFSAAIPEWLATCREALIARNRLVHDELTVFFDETGQPLHEGKVEVLSQKKGYLAAKDMLPPTLFADARDLMQSALEQGVDVLSELLEKMDSSG